VELRHWGRVKHFNLSLTDLINNEINWTLSIDSKAGISSASPLLERIRGLLVVSIIYGRKDLRYWWRHGNIKRCFIHFNRGKNLGNQVIS